MNSVWKELHSNYHEQDWINKPSLFAETAIHYFPKSGKILELGAGLGQDSIFFAKAGYSVVSTDIETSSLRVNLSKHSQEIKVMPVDLKNALPFEKNFFDIVYAHLSLHYFNQETTLGIINDIMRILKPGGILAFLTNSINDPEYNTGKLLEEDFFQIDKATKRYFSIESAKQLTQGFKVILIDDLGQTYKDRAKGIHNLIRFIGRK